MAKPRVMTVAEVRAAFLEHVAEIVDYWETESRAGSVRDRLEGVAFSILVALDGEAAALPGFRVQPNPHESDEAFHCKEGTNWYPNDVDIAGGLHENVHDTFRSRKAVRVKGAALRGAVLRRAFLQRRRADY